MKLITPISYNQPLLILVSRNGLIEKSSAHAYQDFDVHLLKSLDILETAWAANGFSFSYSVKCTKERYRVLQRLDMCAHIQLSRRVSKGRYMPISAVRWACSDGPDSIRSPTRRNRPPPSAFTLSGGGKMVRAPSFTPVWRTKSDTNSWLREPLRDTPSVSLWPNYTHIFVVGEFICYRLHCNYITANVLTQDM